MHYLITGHTGFKGAWLTLWLTSQGHQVSGISLDPLSGALYETAKVDELVLNDFRVDIRNFSQTLTAIEKISPDVVVHMAAQPLVRDSYRDPRATMETNVIGTLNVLEAVSSTPSVKAQVVVTTDKVYRNVNQVAGYVESDALGGDDPYSASKAMADILTHSWVSSFDSPPTAIVRAGNVIGGGDISTDRLIPDLVTAFSHERSPKIRFPNAVRPWQHVLDCLNGYLNVVDSLISGTDVGELNIGPGKESFVTVQEVSNLVGEFYGSNLPIKIDDENHPQEAGLLALNSKKANSLIGWQNKLSFRETVKWTIDWFKLVDSGENSRNVTLRQIDLFRSLNSI